MLIEIKCDKFKEQPQGFSSGLNVIVGSDDGGNSIGKSTFLMIIDFVFGGSDYLEKSIDVHKNIGELSRGYRQRVGLAHALMNDPEILILDEPTSGLDPNQIEDVRSLIKEIGQTRTVIISTHILSEVEMLCSRVIIISGGKLVADSPTEQLRTRYGNSASVRLCVQATEAELSAAINGVEGIESITFEKAEAENLAAAIIAVKTGSEIRPALAKAMLEKGLPLYELVLQRNSLEDVFHTLTADNGAEK